MKILQSNIVKFKSTVKSVSFIIEILLILGSSVSTKPLIKL